jgi:hypothetical protein
MLGPFNLCQIRTTVFFKEAPGSVFGYVVGALSFMIYLQMEKYWADWAICSFFFFIFYRCYFLFLFIYLCLYSIEGALRLLNHYL